MHKKTIIKTILLIIAIIIFIILITIIIKNYTNDNGCIDNYIQFSENNESQIFSIKNITYFSSCNAEIDTNSNSSFTISNLYQYTDIAIFIENNVDESDEYNSSNTLKSVMLNDITFSLEPSIGIPNLYYKNINDFANPTYNDENLIENNITFNTTSEDEIDYSEPLLYNNCANPITLCYVNTGIKDSYTLENNVSNIAHNGSLLKATGITLNSISCQISFKITITNNLDEEFVCPLTLNMPLSTENSTIYDGTLKLKSSTNYNFIKQANI